MEIEFRLREILKRHQLDKHGIINQIVAGTDRNRQTVSAILDNNCRNVRLDTIERIGTFLQKKGIDSTEFVKSILGIRASSFWESIGNKVNIYIGEYQQTQKSGPTWRWISRHDAAVMANLVQELSNPSYFAIETNTQIQTVPRVTLHYVPMHYESESGPIAERLQNQDRRKAKRIYDEIQKNAGKTSFFILGSQRCNLLCEITLNEIFSCEPFVTNTKKKCKIPLYLVYRKGDPVVASSFGGPYNPFLKKGDKDAPGIHYISRNGKWALCPWISEKSDSGVVVTCYYPGTGNLVVMMIGFSGRASNIIGKEFVLNPDRFWPPYFEVKDKRIGFYVCEFELNEHEAQEESDDIHAERFNVISLLLI